MSGELASLSWNVRGLRRREKVRSTYKVISGCKASIVLIQESKLGPEKQRSIRRLCGKNKWSFVSSPTVRTTGGLISMWDTNSFRVEKEIVLDRLIGIFGSLGSANFGVGILNVYAPNAQGERREFFRIVKHLIDQKGSRF
ncbi:hypothetical protein HRI_003072100 [Hibiscus trionum]|uniref:Endonuclease/exonuclease/phosphatase domain-containing protein n=1 Tax=Hibiscus trionum TaxID=183268 RepID=A0A9W7IGW1_HIBTR|nr:hypothetical protein HRI_003072100 [Hibiscus trionum]